MSKSITIMAIVAAVLIAMVSARLPPAMNFKKFASAPSPYTYSTSPQYHQRFTTYTNITAAQLYLKWTQIDDIKIIDVREKDEFETAHIPSAHNHPLSTLEQTFKALPNDKTPEVYIHCAGGVRSLKAIALLETLGYKTKMVNVEDGFNAYRGPTTGGLYDEMSADDLLDIYKNHTISSLSIIDVREQDEYIQGHIPGAKNFPLSTLTADQLPQDYPKLYIHCAGGVRSLKAINKLLDAGYMAVMINIKDGFNAWKGPVETGKATITFADYLAAFPSPATLKVSQQKEQKKRVVADLSAHLAKMVGF